MDNIETNSNYFKPLTGIRAIAAYMVFIHHYDLFKEENFGAGIHSFFGEFHCGVTLFFVLSGFLIAYRYSDMVNFKFRTYILNRVFRIYPMYFILTSTTFILYNVMAKVKAFSLGMFLLNITFLRGFFNDFKFIGIAQGWSLTVEEVFYLLAPLLFILLKRSKFYLIALPILLMLLGVGLVSIFSEIDFYGFFSSYEFMFNYTFFGRCFEFFVGIALAIILKNNLIDVKFKHFTYLGIINIIASILLISLLKGDLEYGIRHPIGKLINTLILPAFGVLLFFYGLITEDTWVSKILGGNFFLLLGKSSYIFYLIHLGFVVHVISKATSNVMFVFLLLNVIAIFLFKFIEEPINNFLRRRFT